MLQEAITKIMSAARPAVEFIVVDGLTQAVNNSKGDRSLVAPPLPQTIELSTLSGLVALIETGINGKDSGMLVADAFIRVDNFASVSLLLRQPDSYGQRAKIANAQPPAVDKFPFGDWINPEKFSIMLQSRFEETQDRAILLSVISRLTSETVATSEDDGITQTVALRKGAALKTEVTLKPRVTLAPFRTFTEITQPPSEFVFRLKQLNAEEPPCLALFEADGGAWKVAAMKQIAATLTESTKVEVIA